jgi:hypothetical protein
MVLRLGFLSRGQFNDAELFLLPYTTPDLLSKTLLRKINRRLALARTELNLPDGCF